MGKKPSSKKKGQFTPRAHPLIVREDPPLVHEDCPNPPIIHGAHANCTASQTGSSSDPSQLQSVDCIAQEAPNTNTPIPPHQGSTLADGSRQANSSQITESPVQYRIFIEPRGDDFRGARTSTISTIIKRHFNGAWTSFSEVPIVCQNLLFEEFGKRFCWLPEHDSQVRINWENVCKRISRGTLANARKKTTAPKWIQIDHCSTMQECYNSPKFKAKLEIGMNREKLVSPSHIGGSISFSEHKERERRENGDSFDLLELHGDLNTIKSGPNKRKIVSEKAWKLSKKVRSLQTYAEGSENSVTQQNNKALVVAANEGIKKGCIFGLGSDAAVLIRPPMLSSIATSISHAMELAQMQKNVDDLEKNMKKMKMEMNKFKRKQKRWDYLLKHLCNQIGLQLPPMDDTDDSDDDSDDDVSVAPVDHHPSVSSGSNPLPPRLPSATAPTHRAI